MKLDKLEVISEFKHLQIREITDDGQFSRRMVSATQTLADDEHQEVRTKSLNFGQMK